VYWGYAYYYLRSGRTLAYQQIFGWSTILSRWGMSSCYNNWDLGRQQVYVDGGEVMWGSPGYEYAY
jgi:hypothetical protein